VSHYENLLLGLSSVPRLAICEVLANVRATVTRFNKTVCIDRSLFAVSTSSECITEGSNISEFHHLNYLTLLDGVRYLWLILTFFRRYLFCFMYVHC
jgi:hypothetical protein